MTYLQKIKNRKPSKKRCDVFSCLNPSYYEKKEEPLKPAEPIETFDKAKQRYGSLVGIIYRRIEKGKKIRLKTARRFLHSANMIGAEVPPEIIAICSGHKPFLGSKKKHGKYKKLIKKVKKEKCPRTYKEYIKSKFWETRKNDYYKIYGRKCKVCGSSVQMSIHHLVYGKYGKEKDEDLVALCWSCHEDFHNSYGVKKDCQKDFAEFCASKVNNPKFN